MIQQGDPRHWTEADSLVVTGQSGRPNDGSWEWLASWIIAKRKSMTSTFSLTYNYNPLTTLIANNYNNRSGNERRCKYQRWKGENLSNEFSARLVLPAGRVVAAAERIKQENIKPSHSKYLPFWCRYAFSVKGWIQETGIVSGVLLPVRSDKSTTSLSSVCQCHLLIMRFVVYQ